MAGQVTLGEQNQPDRWPDEAVADPGRGDVGDAWLGRIAEVGQPGADTLPAQHLGQPLGRAGPFGDQYHPPAAGQPVPDIRQHAV